MKITVYDSRYTHLEVVFFGGSNRTILVDQKCITQKKILMGILDGIRECVGKIKGPEEF